MLKPPHYVSSPGNFFLDFREVVIALKDLEGNLVVYLKNASLPITINCEETQTEAIIASIIGWNHHCVPEENDI